jgi:FixJ family two-component response regulator
MSYRVETTGESNKPQVSRGSACVFVIDDDAGALRSLTRLVKCQGLTVQPFASARQFLAEADHDAPGCLVLDCPPGLSGPELLDQMKESGVTRPTIFISGKADIATSVAAMKAGAVDFLLKPLDRAALIAAIHGAVSQDAERRQIAARRTEAATLLATLTVRETQVLEYLLCGRLNKQIAAELGIVEKTVKVHRARMHAKLGLRSMAAVVRMVDLARSLRTNKVTSEVTA